MIVEKSRFRTQYLTLFSSFIYSSRTLLIHHFTMKGDKVFACSAALSLVLQANMPPRAAAAPVAVKHHDETIADGIRRLSRYDGDFFERLRKLSPDERRAQPVPFIHRGTFGISTDLKIDKHTIVGISSDSATRSIADALTAGYRMIEIDARYDRNGLLVFAHAAEASRQTLLKGRWEDIDTQDLRPADRQMIIRQFKDEGGLEGGVWTNRYLKLDSHVLIEREFIDLWMECNSDTIALLDAKDDGAKYAIMFRKRYPRFAKRIVPMIYNTHFHSATQLIDGVAALGGTIDPEEYLAFTIHHSAMLSMAGYTAFTPQADARKIAGSQIAYVDDLISNFNIVAAVLVLGVDARYFDPDTNTVKNHPKFGDIDDPTEVWMFAKLWVAEQVRSHLQQCHPSILISAPSNRPVLISRGIPYVDHVDTGKAVRIDPTTVNGHLFEQMGQAKNLWSAGAESFIAEDSHDVLGLEGRYSSASYAYRDWDLTGLQDRPDGEWLEDPDYV